jgi:hypothetical protein
VYFDLLTSDAWTFITETAHEKFDYVNEEWLSEVLEPEHPATCPTIAKDILVVNDDTYWIAA